MSREITPSQQVSPIPIGRQSMRSGFSRLAAPPCSLRSSGFTLLEVLAAVALLAIAFAIGLGALGKSAQNAGRSAALDIAVEHAQELLAEQGLTTPLQEGTLSGAFADGMHWTLKIHSLPRPAPLVRGGAALQQQGALLAQAPTVALYQLDVAVRYGAGRVLRLATQRAQAVPSGDNGG
jgi:general secretion pathway protein I